MSNHVREIRKADILGTRIVDVHYTWEIEEGLDCVEYFFTLDRGFTIRTPWAGTRWLTCNVPGGARREEDVREVEGFDVRYGWFGLRWFVKRATEYDDTIRRLKACRISGVFCGKFNETYQSRYPDEAGTIVFDNGAQASNTIVAPHGTGHAGLWYVEPGSPHCKRLENMEDFFSIPVTMEPDES